MKQLTKKQLDTFLGRHTQWSATSKNTKLNHTFKFSSHVDALVFIARITVHAEVLQHHPEITFSYQKVKVTITTHEAKGLTKKDIDLAKRIDNFSG